MTRQSSRPEILVAVSEPNRSRFFPPRIWAALTSLGEVRVVDGISRNDIDRYGAMMRDATVVVTGWSCPPLTPAVLAAAPRLGLLAHTGGSVKAYVTPESWQRGVRVTQAGAAMAHAVAEAALIMTMVLLRRFHRSDHAMRAGKSWWQANESVDRQDELHGNRIGVIGASRTGRAYIALVQALGAHVSVYDPYLDDATTLGVTATSLEELLTTSKVVCIHAPVTAETRHLLGARELAFMPDGALLVNTARSALIDMAALYSEVKSGRIDAALDVYDTEPLPEDDPWRTLPNAFLIPHFGGGTSQSRQRAGEIIVEEIRRYLAGDPLRHEVSRDMLAIMG